MPLMPMPVLPRSSNKKMRWRNALRKLPGLAPLARLFRIVLSPVRRSEWRLMRARPDNLFQPYALTSCDRHPEIFSRMREYLRHCPAPRILSFGCSTGEEVFSLRNYFPQAGIVGIDINPRNVAVCRRELARKPDARIRFVQAASADAEAEASYDAVFCLSVLRHGQLGESRADACDHLIRFADFDRTVAGLARCLKPGGYLVILGSNFRFCDTAAACAFDTEYSIGTSSPRADTPLYGSDNKLLRDTIYNDVIFIKRGRE